LVDALLKLFEIQRAVVYRAGRRKPKSINFLCARGRPHTCRRSAAQSRALVDDSQKVWVCHRLYAGSIKQRERRLARLAPVEVARIIFYPVAVAYLADERQVVIGAALEPLGLKHLALRSKCASLLLELALNVLDSAPRSSSGVT
jgi:hypothetical protein